MREIKFRAWDSVKEKYSYIFDIWEIDMDESYITYIPGVGKSYEEDIILEQFTGLHDKNGKEIYEGDIVRNDWYDVNYRNIGQKYIIRFGVYDDSGIDFGSPSIGFYGLGEDDKEESLLNIENGVYIIGNIHENPEILNED